MASFKRMKTIIQANGKKVNMVEGGQMGCLGFCMWKEWLVVDLAAKNGGFFVVHVLTFFWQWMTKKEKERDPSGRGTFSAPQVALLFMHGLFKYGNVKMAHCAFLVYCCLAYFVNHFSSLGMYNSKIKRHARCWCDHTSTISSTHLRMAAENDLLSF